MNVDELLGNIHLINQKFSDAKWVKGQNGNVLSYTALKLAAMKAYLVEEKESAHKKMLQAEIEMDKQKAIAYTKAMKESNATESIR
jgi:hypothetical protein